MATFLPSTATWQNSSSEEYSGWDVLGPLIGSAVSAGAGIAATGIMAHSAKTMQARQAQHDQEMAAQQEKLLNLQIASEEARLQATQAGSALEGIATTRTLFVVGGVVLGVGLLATAIMIKRKNAAREIEEEEYA